VWREEIFVARYGNEFVCTAEKEEEEDVVVGSKVVEVSIDESDVIEMLIVELIMGAVLVVEFVKLVAVDFVFTNFSFGRFENK
jgi:hypothetical protein